MKVSGRLKAALPVLFLSVLVACADTQEWVSSKTHSQPPPPAADDRTISRQTIARAQSHMQAGDYQEAIDVYQGRYRKAPRDKVLREAYVNSLEQIAGAADQALEQQAFGEAGKIYAILQKNYDRFSGFEQQLTFTSASLSAKLDHCKKTLFKQGFQEYRQGNLSRAIALWEDLLVIDPQNTDIKEALRTARLQQKNLNATE